MRSNVSDGTAVPGFTNGIAFGNNSVDRYAYKQVSIVSGSSATVSVYVIMDDGNAPVVSSNSTSGDFGLVVDGGIVDLGPKLNTVPIGSNVYRVSGYMTSIAGGASKNFGIVKFTGQSARTFRVTGIQVEYGTTATAYRPTTSTLESTANANIHGFNSAAYTLFADYRNTYIGGTGSPQNTLVQLDDGTSANYANLYTLDNAGTPVYLIRSGTVNQAVITTANSANTRWRTSMSCQLNSIKAAGLGVAGTEDTSANMPVSITLLRIGNTEAASAQFNGYIFEAGLFPAVLTQAQINGKTTL